MHACFHKRAVNTAYEMHIPSYSCRRSYSSSEQKDTCVTGHTKNGVLRKLCGGMFALFSPQVGRRNIDKLILQAHVSFLISPTHVGNLVQQWLTKFTFRHGQNTCCYTSHPRRCSQACCFTRASITTHQRESPPCRHILGAHRGVVYAGRHAC